MAAHSKKPLQNLRLTQAFYYAPGRVADETQFYTLAFVADGVCFVSRQ